MNRKLIFLLLLGCLLTPLSVRAAEPVKFFCVELRDGTKAEFASIKSTANHVLKWKYDSNNTREDHYGGTGTCA